MVARCSRAVAPRAVLASARELTAESHSKRFPRTARLTRPSEYTRVFAGAKRLGDRYFTVLASPNEQEHARLGLAISRRNAPRAVDRNRIKRLVRESFRAERDALRPVDLVVMAKPGARTATNAELVSALQHHWRRLMRT